MQAAASIGQSYGRAIESIGDNISGAIKKYQKDKEESEFLTGQAESLTPLLQSFGKDIKDQKSQVAFDEITKKLGNFAGQSLSQKRATLASAGTLVSSFDRARQNENARTQAEILAVNLENLNQQRRDQDAYSQSLSGPTTRDVSREVPVSGLLDQSQYLYNAGKNQPPATQSNFSNIDTEALSKMMNRGDGSQVPDSLPPPSSITAAPIGRGGRVANFVEGMINRVGEYGNRAQGNAITAAPMTAAERDAAMSTSPIPATSITASPMTAAERAEAMPITAASMNARERAAALPTSFNQGIGELPAQTSKRTVIDKVDLTPKELYTNQITSYIAKGGRVTPEINAQFKKDAGVFAPVDINVKPITSADGKVIATAIISKGSLAQLVLPEKPSGPQSDIGKKITDMTNFLAQGQMGAAQLIADELKQGSSKMTEGQGKAYQYAAELFKTNETISKLENKGFNPTNNTWDRFAPNYFKSDEGKQYYSAMDKWIEATLRDRSGATVMDSEYDKARLQYFPAYGDSAINIANKKALRSVAMQAMADRAEGKMNNRYFGATGETPKIEEKKDPAGRSYIRENF